MRRGGTAQSTKPSELTLKKLLQHNQSLIGLVLLLWIHLRHHDHIVFLVLHRVRVVVNQHHVVQIPWQILDQLSQTQQNERFLVAAPTPSVTQSSTPTLMRLPPSPGYMCSLAKIPRKGRTGTAYDKQSIRGPFILKETEESPSCQLTDISFPNSSIPVCSVLSHQKMTS